MKIQKYILPALFIALMLWSCVKQRDLSQNTVIVHFLAEPLGLHPTNDNNIYQRIIFSLTQKKLLLTDIKAFEIIPDLLEEIPVMADDSMAFHCRLKPGIKWDDGSHCTAHDVAFTIKMIKCPFTNNPTSKPIFENIKNVRLYPEDSLRFSIEMNQLYFANLRMLTEIYILQEHFWDQEKILRKYDINSFQKDFTSEQYSDLYQLVQSFNKVDNARIPSRMNGLGPYRVAEWSTGNSVVLERKNNWWGKESKSIYDQHYPEKIIFKIIKDMEPAVLALKKQQIDITTELTTPALIKLKKLDYFNKNFTSDYIGSFVYAYMGLNMKPSADRQPYFIDKRVRRAIAHLTPVEEIIEVLAKGKANRMASFILPMQNDYNHKLPLINLDLAKAKQLLDEAGWIDTDGDNIRDKVINGQKVPFSFTLNYMISPVTKEIGLMIKETMYKAGINVIPNPMDFSVFYQKAFAQEFDAMLGSWSSSAGPEDARQIWHTSSWTSKGANFVGFGNIASDSLIELSNVTLDPERRKEIMFQLQEMVYEEQPYVFIYNATKKIAVHNRFENIELFTEKPHVIINNLKLKESYLRTPDQF